MQNVKNLLEWSKFDFLIHVLRLSCFALQKSVFTTIYFKFTFVKVNLLEWGFWNQRFLHACKSLSRLKQCFTASVLIIGLMPWNSHKFKILKQMTTWAKTLKLLCLKINSPIGASCDKTLSPPLSFPLEWVCNIFGNVVAPDIHAADCLLS